MERLHNPDEMRVSEEESASVEFLLQFEIDSQPMISFQDVLMGITDKLMALPPRLSPPAEELRQCRLIAHRGSTTHFEPGSVSRLENTRPAFEHAVQNGAWGIELDVRWTKDDIPVIAHDSSAERVFSLPLEIEKTDFEVLRKSIPLIPTLDEVIAIKEKVQSPKCHFMIELKKAPLTQKTLSSKRVEALERSLSSLKPEHDYHLISLTPRLLLECEFATREALIPIAEFNVGEISRLTLIEKWGGLMGHYLLITEQLIKRHHKAGQKVGTGFATSRSVLIREIKRGVDWIFTNHATLLSQILENEIKSSARSKN